MFSIATVASSTRMPTASARPPSVMMLTVCPVIHSASTAPISESGMLITTINALRQSRRNKQHHQAGQQRAQRAFQRQAADRARHVGRLVEFVAHLHVRRQHALELAPGSA